MSGYTYKEKLIGDCLIEAHELFSSLEQSHPEHLKEWVVSIHNLQRILAMRILRREHSEIFPSYKNETIIE